MHALLPSVRALAGITLHRRTRVRAIFRNETLAAELAASSIRAEFGADDERRSETIWIAESPATIMGAAMVSPSPLIKIAPMGFGPAKHGDTPQIMAASTRHWQANLRIMRTDFTAAPGNHVAYPILGKQRAVTTNYRI
jgi:hypothetical protein